MSKEAFQGLTIPSEMYDFVTTYFDELNRPDTKRDWTDLDDKINEVICHNCSQGACSDCLVSEDNQQPFVVWLNWQVNKKKGKIT